jgi:hypothetical protein
MKKFLLLISTVFLLAPMTFGEDYPPKGGRDEYPIYWYVYRHADRLKRELDTRHFFRLHGWGCRYLAKITPDGTVIPIELIGSQNKLYDKSIKKIIETTKAEPFGDEIKLDELFIKIDLGYADWGEFVDVGLSPHKDFKEKLYVIYVQTTK